MAALNFNHLRYIHAIAQAGSLTRTAADLNVSPSALSVQVRQLEAQLGQTLFERRGRGLLLTEVGRIALDYAEAIFAGGDELVEMLKGTSASKAVVVRVGALATLSRNFQLGFLSPLKARKDLHLVLPSGTLSALDAHQLDVLLTNTLPTRDGESAWFAHRLAERPISLIGPKPNGRKPKLETLLARESLIVPTPENHIRRTR